MHCLGNASLYSTSRNNFGEPHKHLRAVKRNIKLKNAIRMLFQGKHHKALYYAVNYSDLFYIKGYFYQTMRLQMYIDLWFWAKK